MGYIALMNSRQSIRPCLSDNWVKNSIEAVKYIKKTDYTMLTSIGMSTYDLITSLGSLYSIPMKIFLFRNNNREDAIIDHVTEQFDLKNKPVQFQFIDPDSPASSKESIYKKRDAEIVLQADTIIPVSIRKQGYLQMLFYSNPHKIDNRFKTAYQDHPKSFAYTLSCDSLNDRINEISADYLIHWTKSSNTPWLSERIIDYYNAIIQTESYPRTAFHSLENILQTKTICASPKNMPRKIPCVSFSRKHPRKMLPLFRWRSRHKNMSFEPYGIGFKKEIALQAGVREIVYYDKVQKELLTAGLPAWRTQSRGVKTDWTEEDEFRYKGNFNIDRFTSDQLILFTRFKKEADRLQASTGIQTIYFEKELF